MAALYYPVFAKNASLRRRRSLKKRKAAVHFADPHPPMSQLPLAVLLEEASKEEAPSPYDSPCPTNANGTTAKIKIWKRKIRHLDVSKASHKEY